MSGRGGGRPRRNLPPGSRRPVAGRGSASSGPDPFAALADPVRRRLLERLGAGELTVAELTAGLGVGRAAASRHLEVLREAGLVEVRASGRHRRYRMRPDALIELRGWVDRLDGFWRHGFAALRHHLEERLCGPISGSARSTSIPSTTCGER